MVTAAAPYASLSRARFDEAIELARKGIVTGRGRRGAHLHLDGVNGVVRPRRSAGLAALLGAGAIPELGEYRVVLDPDNVTVGSVHEDFAIEAAAGDIFLLGTHSWRVLKVETGTVRVADAQGMPPTTPFWLGEAPARTEELSAQVSALRALVEALPRRERRRRRARRGARRGGRRRRRRGDGRRLPRGRPARARRAADDGPARGRALLRRQRGRPAGRARPARRADQPRARPRAAQALLRDVRLRAAGRRQRRRGHDRARAAPLLPAHRRREDGAAGQGARDPHPGGAPAADARGAVALERRARARDAEGDDGGPAPDPPPAHGGRRPHGRDVAVARGLPGERARRADPDPGPPARPPDRRRRALRAARRRRASRRCSSRIAVGRGRGRARRVRRSPRCSPTGS